MSTVPFIQRLFDPKDLGVTNIGITRGTNPNVTSEEILQEVEKAFKQIEAGDFEEVDLDELDQEQKEGWDGYLEKEIK